MQGIQERITTSLPLLITSENFAFLVVGRTRRRFVSWTQLYTAELSVFKSTWRFIFFRKDNQKRLPDLPDFEALLRLVDLIQFLRGEQVYGTIVIHE